MSLRYETTGRRKTAEALDCSEYTVRRLAAAGELSLVDLSPRRVIVTYESIEGLLKRKAR